MDFSTYNPLQKEAICAPLQPLLIVAGAGTGKTRTLIGRLLYYIEQGINPASIAAITFTNKAAREMAERVRHSSVRFGASGEPYIGTFHALGAKILRQEASHLGRGRNYVIYDANDSFQTVKKIVKELGVSAPGATPSFFHEAVGHIKNGSLSAEGLRASGRAVDSARLRVYEAYEAALERANAFDFDDLITKTTRILTSHPTIGRKWSNLYSHLLVDEYQDINNAQYEMLKALLGAHRSLAVVGDDRQTIYGWRGSNMEIFLDFKKEFPDAHIVTLEQNYRSTPTILSASGGLIAHNERQNKSPLWTKNPDGAKVRIIEEVSEEAEATRIISSLKADLAAGEQEIAILYRTNAQSRPFEQALAEEGIPYQVYGGLKFYERKEVKDIVAAVRYASNPKDEASKDRILKTFLKRKSAAIFAALSGMENAPIGDIIAAFLSASDFTTYLEGLSNTRDRRENVAELIHFAGSFPDASTFLERAALMQSDERNGGHEHAKVQLLTMHLAKGLEFSRVYVVGVKEGLLPHQYSCSSSSEVEEERRLLYVAMTRAKMDLTISYWDMPSRFLYEISPEFTQFSSANHEPHSALAEEDYITLD